MSNIEFDLFSNRSTSEISDEYYHSNCNFDDPIILNEEGIKRKNEHFQKCWENNFKLNEFDTSNFSYIIANNECNDNTIDKQNNFLGKKIERNDDYNEDDVEKPNQEKLKIFDIIFKVII